MNIGGDSNNEWCMTCFIKRILKNCELYLLTLPIYSTPYLLYLSMYIITMIWNHSCRDIIISTFTSNSKHDKNMKVKEISREFAGSVSTRILLQKYFCPIFGPIVQMQQLNWTIEPVTYPKIDCWFIDITSDALNFVVNTVVIQYCVYYEI